MPASFVISDTHFAHRNIVVFTDANGNKIRPWDDLDAMTEDMVKWWNETVKPSDKVYHLGDVAIARRGLEVLKRLNGRKILVRGNHDIFKLKDYAEHFDDIRGVHVIDKHRVVMSHIPLHAVSGSRWVGNIHGHMHHKKIDDPFYFNVSVEQINYRPVLLDDVLKHFKEMQE
jgi:calcineurin-like phosphoesterase family protein